VKGLHSLIRWKRYLLDERRKALALLRGRALDLADEARKLEEAPAAEQPVVAEDASLGFALGGFIEGLLTRRRAITESEARLAEEIAVAEDAVQTAFAELKRFEIAAAREADAARAAEAAEEVKEADELALDKYRRSRLRN
jgi:flagellar protein FliJ